MTQRASLAARVRAARKGIALLLAMVVLGILGLLLASIAMQVGTTRKTVDRRHQDVQATWLARSGIELGVQKWLADPKAYKGESVELVADSSVTIAVEVLRDEVIISSTARYPTYERNPVTTSLRRPFRRVTDGDRVRLEFDLNPTEELPVPKAD